MQQLAWRKRQKAKEGSLFERATMATRCRGGGALVAQDRDRDGRFSSSTATRGSLGPLPPARAAAMPASHRQALRLCTTCQRMYEASDDGGDVCGACRRRAQAQQLLHTQAQQKLQLRLATMLAWSKVLHERLGSESVVPSDLDMVIVEQINDCLVRIKLPSETFSDFYAFRGKWSGKLPRSLRPYEDPNQAGEFVTELKC